MRTLFKFSIDSLRASSDAQVLTNEAKLRAGTPSLRMRIQNDAAQASKQTTYRSSSS